MRALVPLMTAGLILGVAGSAAATTDAAGPGPTTAVYAVGPPIIYDHDLVHDGATVALLSGSTGGRTMSLLSVRGLAEKHGFGAHLHVNPCGPTPTDAGAHFRRVADEGSNATNEVWLDFTTGKLGTGAALAHNPWAYGEDLPQSLVIHGGPTDGHGMAGSPVACITLSERRP